MKKALRETQTLRAGCSRWSQKISPRRRPPSRGAGPPKFNQLEMVTTCTYRPSLVKIDERNFELYRGNRHRPPARSPACYRQDRLQYTAPLASAQCIEFVRISQTSITSSAVIHHIMIFPNFMHGFLNESIVSAKITHSVELFYTFNCNSYSKYRYYYASAPIGRRH